MVQGGVPFNSRAEVHVKRGGTKEDYSEVFVTTTYLKWEKQVVVEATQSVGTWIQRRESDYKYDAPNVIV